MTKAHGSPKNYTIYAIVTSDMGKLEVHVNKTITEDLRCVLRRHITRKNSLTAEVFRRGEHTTPPTIHALETIFGDAALAYRHVVAWHRCFNEAGYITYAWEGVEYAACNMLRDTAEIYNRIRCIDLEKLLSVPYVPPRKQLPKPLTSPQTTKDSVQLNMRIDRSEYNAFMALCTEYNLTQRGGFVMLLENHNPDASNQLLLEQKQTIVDQVEKIRELTEQANRLPRGAKADIRIIEALGFFRTGIARYIELSMDNANSEKTKMKCLSWNQFDASGFDRRRYQYPETDGYTILKLEAMCYGHGRSPAIFLWGINAENNHPIKVRFYHKRIYMGLSVPHSPYLKEGNLLMVGHKQAPDGAADMYMALPLMKNATLWQEAFAAEGKKVSLDELIRNANRTNI